MVTRSRAHMGHLNRCNTYIGALDWMCKDMPTLVEKMALVSCLLYSPLETGTRAKRMGDAVWKALGGELLAWWP